MKIKFLLFPILLLFACTKSIAQCGPTTNLGHQFTNGINTFTWDAVPTATQYELWITESGAYSAPDLLAVMTTNNFVTPGGVLSASYDYWIVTTCQNGSMYNSSIYTLSIPCPEPINLNAANITQNSATLNWTNPYATDPNYGQGVALSYRLLGGSWITLSNYTLASTFNLPNLAAGTTYEWCVNLSCAYYNSSPVISTFTTLAPICPASLSQSVLNITNTSAKLNWTSVSIATSYSIQYKLNTSNTWTTITVNNNFYTLNGLSINAGYEWKVAANCSYGQSNYSPISSFITNCISMNNSTSFIQYAKVKALVRVSGADANGYIDYYALENAQAGSVVTIKVKAGFVGGNSAHDLAAYLDFNRNI